MKSFSLFQICVLVLLVIIVIEGWVFINRLGTVPTLKDLESQEYVPQGIIGQLWRIGNVNVNVFDSLQGIRDTLEKTSR